MSTEATKQARLDNWAMFLLSRLQVFFNKTDYCDLTLQFEGNVQLKVHRVIMNACTEYFQLLEQTCTMKDDVLVMPPDLQADVILPVVNFMYTGILEYQHSIFEKLYQTAELMNMSVLLKILDAQRMKGKSSVRATPTITSQGRRTLIKSSGPGDKLPAMLPGRKLPIWKRKQVPVAPVQVNPVKPYSPEPRSQGSDTNMIQPRFDNTPRPTRFEWPDEDIKDIKPFDQLSIDSSFDTLSYTSKPLLTQEEELRSSHGNSVFDDLRQLPTTKPVRVVKDYKDKDGHHNSAVDMEDLKSYVKEQKIRSNLAEYDEDPDDPDYVPDRKRRSAIALASAKRAKLEKENAKSKMDHSKILSEVLKKYPHLVQKNKNIRLKIMAKSGSSSSGSGSSKEDKRYSVPSKPIETTWTCTKCTTNGEPVEFVLYYLYRKHMTDVHHKQFDARECKHCGAMHDQPIAMAYHMYMAHVIAPPRNIVFPKCSRCAYTAMDAQKMKRHTAYHELNPRHTQCSTCKLGYANDHAMKLHMQLAGHGNKGQMSFDCQYCTRQLNSPNSLFVHCRNTHYEDAKKDGMLSLCDTEMNLDEEEEEEEEVEAEVAAVENEQVVQQSQPLQEEAPTLAPFDIVVLDNDQSYILPNNQQATPTSQHEGAGFVALPELQGQTYINQGDITSTDELVMVLTDHDYNDETSNNTLINNENSNIVVLYSNPVEGQQNQFIASQGNLMLNSATGILELHNNHIASQGETIEMIQKDIESHVVAAATTIVKPPEEDERKLIAVEEEGTGRLINTIEEEVPQKSDFSALVEQTQQPAPEEDALLKHDSPEIIQPVVSMPTPMEIDQEESTAVLTTLTNVPVTTTAPIESISSSLDEEANLMVTSVVAIPVTTDTITTEANTILQSEIVFAPQVNENNTAPLENVQLEDSSQVEGESNNKAEPEVKPLNVATIEDVPEAMEVDGIKSTVADDVAVPGNVADLTDVADVTEPVNENIPQKEANDANVLNEVEAMPAPDVQQIDSATTLPVSNDNPCAENPDTIAEGPKEEIEITPVKNDENVGTVDNEIVQGAEEETIPEPPHSSAVMPLPEPQPAQNTETIAKTNDGKIGDGISNLLTDWEDTDSQQSEQGRGTVNKLINDWDD